MILPARLRRLRTILGLAVVAVAGTLAAVMLRPRPAGPPAPVSEQVLAVEDEGGESASQVSTRFDFTRTREGRTTYRVQAERVLGLEGTVYRLEEPEIDVHHETGEVTRIAGDRGEFDTERETGRIDGEARAILSSGVTLDARALLYGAAGETLTTDGEARFSREDMRGRGDAMVYDPATRLLELERNVRVVGEDAPGSRWVLESTWLEYHTGSGRIRTGPFTLVGDHGDLAGQALDLIVDPETSRAERLIATGDASLREPSVGGKPGGRLDGDRIEVEPDPSGSGPPARVEATGSASLQPGQGRTRDVREVRADRIQVRKDVPGGATPRLMDAEGSVRVRLEPVEPGGQSWLESERLQASLGPSSELETGEATGSVRYEGVRGRASGETATFEAAGERLRLRGRPDRPPTLIGPDRQVTARSLLVEQGAGTFLADGDVRTVSRGDVSGPFQASDEPVYGTSDFLRASRDEDRVVYQGAVRLWQGDNLLQADRVEIHPEAGELEAEGRVLTRSRSEDADGGPRLLDGRSRRLVYRDADRVAVYIDDAALQMGEDRVEASRIEVTLDETRDVERVVADGRVRLRFRTHRGEGDHLDYRPRDEVALLRGDGRLAEAEDIANQRVVRGSSLTFDLSDGRIHVESAPGGRTWITLGPDGEPPDGDERDGPQPRGPAPGH